MRQYRIDRLLEAVSDIETGLEDLRAVLNELGEVQALADERLERIEYLELILEEYGINPDEKRQYRIDAVAEFVKSLGV